jgi:membrane dipeptidase
VWRDRPSINREEARRLHAEAFVVDTAHAGTYSVPSQRIRTERDALLRQGAHRAQLMPALRKLAIAELKETSDACRAYRDLWDRTGVTVGLATTAAWEPSGEGGFEAAVHEIAQVQEMVRLSAGAVRLARSASDMERAHHERQHAIAIMWQNTTPLGHDLDRLDTFHALGLRIVQLTYNLRNLVGDGCTERNAGGLSRFGVALVERLNALRIAVDASHSSEAVGWDALRASTAPISLNHTAAKAIYQHDRGKADDLIKAVADRGGYIGVVLIAGFLTSATPATLDHFAEHVEHIARVAGVDAVGVGADMGGIYGMGPDAPFERYYRPGYPWHGFSPGHRTYVRKLDGFSTIEDWPNITVTLARRGFNEDELRKILGLNYLRFFREVVG